MKTKQRVRLLDTRKVLAGVCTPTPRRFDVGTVAGFAADGTPLVKFQCCTVPLPVLREGLEAAEKLGERLWNEIAYDEGEDIVERLLEALGIQP